MTLNYIRYSLRQTFVSLARNAWLAIISATMIAISLIILGAFLLAAVNVNTFMQSIEETLEIAVFLTDGADAEVLRNRLESLEGVEDAAFVSKEQGLQEFGESMVDADLFQDLQGEQNPLPDMFRVRVKEADSVSSLALQIGRMEGVEKVQYGEELVHWLQRFTRWVNTFSLGVGLSLAVAAVFLIITTIRLSVLARQGEISLMKYLGASNWFIRIPFVLEGMLMGWLGTLFAVAVLGFSYYYLAVFLQNAALAFFLRPVTETGVLIAVLGGLALLGTLMGGFGSILSVRRFLRV